MPCVSNKTIVPAGLKCPLFYADRNGDISGTKVGVFLLLDGLSCGGQPGTISNLPLSQQHTPLVAPLLGLKAGEEQQRNLSTPLLLTQQQQQPTANSSSTTDSGNSSKLSGSAA